MIKLWLQNWLTRHEKVTSPETDAFLLDMTPPEISSTIADSHPAFTEYLSEYAPIVTGVNTDGR